MVIIHEKRVAVSHCHALKGFPDQINSANALQRLVQAVSSLYVCAGHPEEEFVSLVEARHSMYALVTQRRSLYLL